VKKINLHLQHGWGFDQSCWSDLLSYASPSSVSFGERGYFKGKLAGHVPIGNYNITISHSLGLHLLSDELLNRTDFLVIISGFQFFHGERPADGRFSRRHLLKMFHDLEDDPMALLGRFYHDCGTEFVGVEPDRLHLEPLHRDLILLDSHHLDPAKLHGIGNILIIHGERDRIVPLVRAENLLQKLPRAVLKVVEGGDHGLIFSHPERCWQIISGYCEDGVLT